MKLEISLGSFVEEMESVSEEVRVFLNIRTGRFVRLSGDGVDGAKGDESGGVDGYDDFCELPDQFDIQEYAIMQRFCHTVADAELRSGLLRSLQGRGASMRISSTVHSYGIADEWLAFRRAAFREIAMGWMEKHGVVWRDELEEKRSEKAVND